MFGIPEALARRMRSFGSRPYLFRKYVALWGYRWTALVCLPAARFHGYPRPERDTRGAPLRNKKPVLKLIYLYPQSNSPARRVFPAVLLTRRVPLRSADNADPFDWQTAPRRRQVTLWHPILAAH